MTADGAYDSRAVYQAIANHPSHQPTKVIIPPRRNARLGRKSDPVESERDETIHSIHEIGRRRWQKESGYTRRSLVETAMYRYKTILGGRLRARNLESQRIEIKCWLLHTQSDHRPGNAGQLSRRLKRHVRGSPALPIGPCNKAKKDGKFRDAPDTDGRHLGVRKDFSGAQASGYLWRAGGRNRGWTSVAGAC